MMSIYPNLYDYSFYGAYEGVLFLDGYTFIISMDGFEPYRILCDRQDFFCKIP